MAATFGSGSWSWSAPLRDAAVGPLPDPTSILVSVSADGWQVSGDGVTATPTDGGLMAISATGADQWELQRPTAWLRWLVQLAQAAVVAAGISLARSEDVAR